MEIEPLVVGDIDEELGRCGIRVAGARHGYRARNVGQPGFRALLGFDRNRRARRLLPEARVVSAALDHEALDDAVEQRARVVPVLDVFEEVVDGLRCGVWIELDPDRTRAGVELDLRIGGQRRRGDQRKQKCWNEQQAARHGTNLLQLAGGVSRISLSFAAALRLRLSRASVFSYSTPARRA